MCPKKRDRDSWNVSVCSHRLHDIYGAQALSLPANVSALRLDLRPQVFQP